MFDRLHVTVNHLTNKIQGKITVRPNNNRFRGVIESMDQKSVTYSGGVLLFDKIFIKLKSKVERTSSFVCSDAIMIIGFCSCGQ
jgi:hypothetical protein